jgi:lysophospholipase L1-like esterase
MIEEQFPVAIPLLEARNLNRNPRDDVEVTTVHIGGNDVFGPIIGACLGPSPGTCLGTIQDEFSHYQTDLNNALSMLREAGDKAKIVIGTYDNPFRDQSPLTCPGLAGNPVVISLGNLVLEGGPGVPQGLHDIMRSVAADHGIEVAEVFGDLNTEKNWFDCLHPTQAGYDKVSEAFLEALRLEQSE